MLQCTCDLLHRMMKCRRRGNLLHRMMKCRRRGNLQGEQEPRDWPNKTLLERLALFTPLLLGILWLEKAHYLQPSPTSLWSHWGTWLGIYLLKPHCWWKLSILLLLRFANDILVSLLALLEFRQFSMLLCFHLILHSPSVLILKVAIVSTQLAINTSSSSE